MTSIQKAQLELLEETAAFFNLSNRCETVAGMCKYHVDGKEGCAIGRKIQDIELRKELDAGTNTGVDYSKVFDRLPNDLKELGQDFLSNLQGLHDDTYNWSETGLSKSGQKSVYRIKEKFGLLE